MNDIQELIEAVHAAGATIRAEGSNLKVKPFGVISPELKSLLKDRKAEVVIHLQLEAALRRAEAVEITIAILDQHRLRIVFLEQDATDSYVEPRLT